MKHYSKEFKGRSAEAVRRDRREESRAATRHCVLHAGGLARIRRNAPPAKTLSAEEQSIRIRELEREVSELRTANDILKDALGFSQRPQEVKVCERHLFIVRRKGVYTAKGYVPCSAPKRVRYYRLLKQGQAQQPSASCGKVKKILEEHPDNRNYGVDRVCLALEQDGVDVSRRTVYRVMKENGWLHKDAFHTVSRRPRQTQEQENLLKWDFSAQRRWKNFSRILPRYSAQTASCMFHRSWTASARRDRRARDAGQYEERAVH